MSVAPLDTLRSTWHRARAGWRRFLGIYWYAVTWHYLFARACRPSQPPKRNNRYLVALPTYESEGIGGQFVKWNTARLLAHKHGLQFVHHPFTSSSHSPSLDWEAFLGFGAGEVQHASLRKRDDIRVIDLPSLQISESGVTHGRVKTPSDFVCIILGRVLASRSVLFRLGPDTLIDGQAKQLDELKAKYRARRLASKPVDCAPTTASVTVAVHVRRGDVRALRESGSAEGQKRWLDEAYYVNVCDGINQALGMENVEIRVYSDDMPASFEKLQTIVNVRFRIDHNEPVQADIAFHEMTTADILVVGMSSFSYLAALLSDGMKLVPHPYAHDVPADWIECDAAGSFDALQFLASMESLRKARQGVRPLRPEPMHSHA